MLFGAHVSIAGGIPNAPLNAAEENNECFQMFTRSPRGGRAAAITDAMVSDFQKNCEDAGIERSYVHTPYYINFASSKARIRKGSIAVVREELERASQLGVTALMTHLGSAKDVGSEKAVEMTIAGLWEALDGYMGSCQFLVENAAGAGHVIGSTFEELSAILSGIDNYDVGVCFDTCHAFASGYDLRTAAAVKKTLADFGKHIGLKKLQLIHANDSKTELGAQRDRHEHIGKGHIGMAGWKAIVQSATLKDVDCILETPSGTERDHDLKTLKKLRKK